jgi:hypothetical protein
VLASVYKERLRLTAELLILDNASGHDLERFLGLSRHSVTGDKDAAIENVILLGGLYDSKGQFVPLEVESIAGAVSRGGLCAPGWLCEMVAPPGSKVWHEDGTFSDVSGQVVSFRW